jgi:hypothetical protein
MRANQFHHLAWIRTVVHQVAEHPQLVMRFREHRLQRFEVGVNVGNDEKLHGLGAKSAWVSFLAGTGAIVLTFLAGAELDPGIFRTKWKEAMGVGLVGFFGPFLGQRQSRTLC